ncbi:RNA-binding, RBD [Glarea lozoyensis ATCC 20868]|uniref:RNA-binding, RBD n=1 Tax=Glarea lozoyensis (strain ATCC 20868 / MF5171) TaxID=1116229 RepID=S3DI70_GLAL2|nr:RNA-binding, RBD [Glarea lozoyensis ATCC 20868]EPE36829.1 RNA-binding, RBD [Glarea lozoyensis ATCC 20868]
MSKPNSTPVPRAGLSLYANLLDSNSTTSSATVSRGPVVFKPNPDVQEDASSKKPNIDAATLRFQPTKRPQLPQKAKPKGQFPKAVPQETGSFPASISKPPQTAKPAVKSTLADWTATGDDDDVNGFYAGEKRQRGGRKRRKNKHREEHVAAQDWDDIYDPARPNSYEEYKHSDEKIREIREWKDRLYAHRMARKSESEKDSDDEDYRPQMNSQFAPPSNYSFAPPPIDPPSPKASTVPPPPPLETNPPALELPKPAIIEGAISRAPVRYNLPPAPSELPSSEAELEQALAAEPEEGDELTVTEDTPRSRRPGQKGFAERLMSKYGWSKGTGLGADGSGIVNPLRVQIEKRKKKSDAEGGGFRDPPGGRGKIIGGKKNVPEKESETGKFGAMSEVVVLRGMVDGMNLDEEVESAGDGGLMQEIGDECDEKACSFLQYGRVERVYIDRNGETPKVFVKFTNQLSALRAVNALEGRIFNGNTISALFYDTETFETGNYEAKF